MLPGFHLCAAPAKTGTYFKRARQQHFDLVINNFEQHHSLLLSSPLSAKHTHRLYEERRGKTKMKALQVQLLWDKRRLLHSYLIASFIFIYLLLIMDHIA